MIAPCFVDSNVLIYPEESDERAQRASECVRALAADNSLVVSPQIVAEVYVNAARSAGVQRATALAREIMEFSFVQALDRHTSALALEIAERYRISLWDAQVIAAAVAAGTSYLLTEDLQDGQVIEGVTIVNPFREGFELGTLRDSDEGEAAP